MERLLRWKFSIQHIAGAKNYGPEALSRSPAPLANLASINFIDPESAEWSDRLEGQVRASASNQRILLTSWDSVHKAGIADRIYADLLHALQSDHDQHLWEENLKEFKRFKNDMSTVYGVVLFRGRVVIPLPLRQQVLQSINRSHQGTTGMSLRTNNSVW